MSVFAGFKKIENAPIAISKIVDDLRTFLKANETLISDVKSVESRYVQRNNEIEALQIEVNRLSGEIAEFNKKRDEAISLLEEELKKKRDDCDRVMSAQYGKLHSENEILDGLHAVYI